MVLCAIMAKPLFKKQGYCPICETDVTFNAWGENLRDAYLCGRCGSVPRERALMVALNGFCPDWRDMKIHESSPGERGVSLRLKDECPGYLPTHYSPDIPLGDHSPEGGWLNQDLEHQTFPDDSFDLVVTQDVFEHLFDPDAASREIARTLKPGGIHVFTTPLVFGAGRESIQCAVRGTDGQIIHLQKPDYHLNPIDAKGSLVTFWWGYDIAPRIDAAAPFQTTIWKDERPEFGIAGPLIEVLVSMKKPAAPF